MLITIWKYYMSKVAGIPKEIVKFLLYTLRKNNQVSLTIGQILGTMAENTGWLQLLIPTLAFGWLGSPEH